MYILNCLLNSCAHNKFGLKGACGTLVGHPLDTIKTIQQASNKKISSAIYDIVVQSKGVSID